MVDCHESHIPARPHDLVLLLGAFLCHEIVLHKCGVAVNVHHREHALVKDILCKMMLGSKRGALDFAEVLENQPIVCLLVIDG